MLTTVVGSYPSLPRSPTSLMEKIKDLGGSYDSFHPAIKLAVKDQVRAGIDIISDGQVREDMLAIFALNIPGMGVDENVPVINSRITPASFPIVANDLKYALHIAQKLSPEFQSNGTILSKEGFRTEFKGIKGIITGPSTLAHSCPIQGFYGDDDKEKVIRDLALALKKEAEYLESAGASLIQIDEPYLSTGMVDIKTAKEAIKIITKNLSIPTAMHVCGSIQSVFEDLLRFDTDILDCEFAGQPQNLETLGVVNLRGKKIGMGVIDSKSDEVEEKEQVISLIKQGIELVGEENLIIDPDCGMRMRSREAAYKKLKIMVEAVKWLS